MEIIFIKNNINNSRIKICKKSNHNQTFVTNIYLKKDSFSIKLCIRKFYRIIFYKMNRIGSTFALCAVGYTYYQNNYLSAKKVPLYIGIDLGATNAKAGIVDDNGKLISRCSKKIEDYSFDSVMDLLIDCSNEALKDKHLSMKDIKAIGVGSPGLLDYDVFFNLFLEWCIKSSCKFPMEKCRNL